MNRRTSRGHEVIDFARDVLGEPLTPWQEWFVIHALELLPDGSYRFRIILLLVARQNGKTHVGRVLTLWKLFVDGARLILGVGQDLSLAREVWQGCVDTIRGVPALVDEFDLQRNTNGDEYFRLTSGARYKISAATRSAGRGLSVDVLNFEELREQRDWLAWSALSKTTSARPNSQIFCYSNAGDDLSIVLNQLRESALANRDESIGIFEWSAPDGCALDDRDAIAQANPGVGYTISEAAIRTSLASDPPSVFRTEVLCQRVDTIDGAIDVAAWKDCKDASGTLDEVRDRVVTCLDVSPDGAHVALVAAAPLPDGRVRVEVVGAWRSTDLARVELPELIERVKPRALAWFAAGPAAALAPMLRALTVVPPPPGKHLPRAEQGKPLRLELAGRDVTEACQGFADLASARRLLHPGDPLLDAHAAGAQRLNQGDGWRFVRRGAGHCSAVYAAAGATHVALTLPAPRPAARAWAV